MRMSLFVCVLALGAAACDATRGTYVTPGDLGPQGRGSVAAGGAGSAAGAAAGGKSVHPLAVALANQDRNGLSPENQAKRDGFDSRSISLTRRREDQARGLYELEQRRARMTLDQASAMASEVITLQSAEREQRLAAENLQHFVDVERVRRLAEKALELKSSADNLLEAREELAQLEMMYSESDLGDATAEIVLNRSRRRLQRAEEGHLLREQRAEELSTITLPRENDRLADELAGKTVALENARRAAEAGRLARETALRDLEFDAKKLAREQDDIARDEILLAAEIARWERDLAAENAEAAPAGAAGSVP